MALLAVLQFYNDDSFRVWFLQTYNVKARDPVGSKNINNFLKLLRIFANRTAHEGFVVKWPLNLFKCLFSKYCVLIALSMSICLNACLANIVYWSHYRCQNWGSQTDTKPATFRTCGSVVIWLQFKSETFGHY